MENQDSFFTPKTLRNFAGYWINTNKSDKPPITNDGRWTESYNILADIHFTKNNSLTGKFRECIPLKPSDIFHIPTGHVLEIGFIGGNKDNDMCPVAVRPIYKNINEIDPHQIYVFNWENKHLGAMAVFLARRYDKKTILCDIAALEKKMFEQKINHPEDPKLVYQETLDFINEIAKTHYSAHYADAYNLFIITYMGCLMEERYTKYWLRWLDNKPTNEYYIQTTSWGRHSKLFLFFAVLFTAENKYDVFCKMTIDEICESTKPKKFRKKYIDMPEYKPDAWLTLTNAMRYGYNVDNLKESLLLGPIDELHLWQTRLEANTRRYITNQKDCLEMPNCVDKTVYIVPTESKLLHSINQQCANTVS